MSNYTFADAHREDKEPAPNAPVNSAEVKETFRPSAYHNRDRSTLHVLAFTYVDSHKPFQWFYGLLLTAQGRNGSIIMFSDGRAVHVETIRHITQRNSAQFWIYPDETHLLDIDEVRLLALFMEGKTQ